MRTILFSTFLLILPELVFAQLSQLQIVGKPEKSETEIVGLRDESGRFCAAIQTISDMDGFQYDSYNGVVKVDDEPGKDMVYLSPDERVLEIYRSGYEPLKIILSEMGVKLESRQVWIIKLAGEGKLSIISTPDEAEFYMDGTRYGETPFEGKFQKGTYEITLKKRLYHDFIQKVQVMSDTTMKYVFDMFPQYGSLNLTSEPVEAEVFLDGNLIGTTPIKMKKILSGEHRLTIRKKPYEDVRKTITIKDGEELKDNVILPRTPESINIEEQEIWTKRRTWTLIGTGTFALAGLGFKLLADAKYDEYNKATSTNKAVDLRKRVENFDLLTIISFSVSGVLAGWTVYNHFRIPKSNVNLSVNVTPNKIMASIEF